MRQTLEAGILATDLADYLVGKDIPFRDAHGLVGIAVRKAAEKGVSLDKLPLQELKAIHPAFAEDVKTVFDFDAAVARRAVPGGTAPKAVQTRCSKPKN